MAKMCPILTAGILPVFNISLNSVDSSDNYSLTRRIVCEEHSCEFWDEDSKKCEYKNVVIIKQNG